MNIEDYLKELIRFRKFTVKSFSEYIGIPYSTLRDILSRDIKKTSIENYLKICNGLRVDPEELLGEFSKPSYLNNYLLDLEADLDYEQRLEENKYKEKLIDTLQNLNYEFDEDAFSFEEFIVDELKVINTELDTTYEVDPRELYDEMKETFSNIVELQAQSNLQIEFDEVRKTFEKLNTANSIVEKPDLYKVNVTEKVAAGRGYSYGNNETTPYYTDRADLRPYDLATLVKGDSMEPKYKDGDVVLLRQGYDNANGDVYVIDYDGKSYIKKLYNDGDRFRMVSINRKYDNIIIDIPPENGKYFNIIGKVIDSFTPVKL